MALTDTQKTDVIFHMGWPGKTLLEGSTDYSKIISDRLDGLTDEMEALIGKLLGKIKKIDDKLMEALDRFSTKRVDDIELNPRERELLRAERRRYLNQLSELTDVPLQASGGVVFSVRN